MADRLPLARWLPAMCFGTSERIAGTQKEGSAASDRRISVHLAPATRTLAQTVESLDRPF